MKNAHPQKGWMLPRRSGQARCQGLGLFSWLSWVWWPGWVMRTTPSLCRPLIRLPARASAKRRRLRPLALDIDVSFSF